MEIMEHQNLVIVVLLLINTSFFISLILGVNISPSLYAWLAVLVLPVNSALNPVLYTLTTAAFKQQVSSFFFKMINTIYITNPKT